MSDEQVLGRLAEAVINGEEEEAGKVAREALRLGVEPLRAIQNGGAVGMKEIGRRFELFEAFLPELVLAAKAMKAAIDVLLPEIKAAGLEMKASGKIVLGTVSEDLHDIGKNLVGAMLSVSGYEVYDLGVSVSIKAFLKKASEVGADIIGMSSLLSTSAYYQEELIKYLVDNGQRENYYIIVGGGPVTAEWAEQIGADGYAKTAASVPALCNQLLFGSRAPLKKPLIIGE